MNRVIAISVLVVLFARQIYAQDDNSLGSLEKRIAELEKRIERLESSILKIEAPEKTTFVVPVQFLDVKRFEPHLAKIEQSFKKDSLSIVIDQRINALVITSAANSKDAAKNHVQKWIHRLESVK